MLETYTVTTLYQYYHMTWMEDVKQRSSHRITSVEPAIKAILFQNLKDVLDVYWILWGRAAPHSEDDHNEIIQQGTAIPQTSSSFIRSPKVGFI